MLGALCPVPDDRLAEVRALADDVFVTARGRPPGVLKRYPGLFEPGADAETVAVVEDGRIRGSLALRPLAFPGQPQPWSVAMVGLVAVQAEMRSRGLGESLLRAARRRLEHLGAEVAVLWAGKHDLYRRLGWSEHDPGVLGDAPGDPGGAIPPGVSIAPLGGDAARRLTALRDHWAADVPVRTVERWNALPFPVTGVVTVVAGAADAPDAYALAGERGDERFLYEYVGDPKAFDAVWAGVCAGCRRVTVNERRGGIPHTQLAARGVPFVDQRLALWLELAPPDGTASLVGRHVPWFDRI